MVVWAGSRDAKGKQFRKGRQSCGQHHQSVWLLDCEKRDMGPWKDSPLVFPGVRGQGQGVQRQIESQPEARVSDFSCPQPHFDTAAKRQSRELGDVVEFHFCPLEEERLRA